MVHNISRSTTDLVVYYLLGRWDLLLSGCTDSAVCDQQQLLFYLLLRDLTPMMALHEEMDPRLVAFLSTSQSSKMIICRRRLLRALKSISDEDEAVCIERFVASFFAQVIDLFAECVPKCVSWICHLIAGYECDFVCALRSFQGVYRCSLAGRLPQRLTIVLGMHRSGTSALSGMLGAAGLNAPSDSLGATVSNPYGYWESDYLVELSNKLFVDLGVNWSTAYDLSLGWHRQAVASEWVMNYIIGMMHFYDVKQHILLKDPRLCFLLRPLIPCFHSGLVSATYVLILRSPVEVVFSLRKSEGIDFGQSLCLWIASVLMSERLTRQCDRLIVTYPQLLERPADILESLKMIWGDDALAPGAKMAPEFIDSSLYRQRSMNLRADLWGSNPKLHSLLTIAEKLYDLMSKPFDAQQESHLDQLNLEWLSERASWR